MTVNCHPLYLWHPYWSVFFFYNIYSFHQLVTVVLYRLNFPLSFLVLNI